MKEWTGLEWNIVLRKAENREEWRKLVVKSTVVPNGQPDYGMDQIRSDQISSCTLADKLEPFH